MNRDHHRVGFDADDRPVVIEEYSGYLGGKLYYETYRDHLAGAGLVEEAHFYADGRPIYLHEYRYAEGRIRSASSVATHGGGYEEYQYTGERVTRIAVHHAARTDQPGRPLRALAADRGRGRELLCAVAAELNAYDWGGVLPMTDDFVVYAIDLELVDLERNMTACLPGDRLALLRGRGPL